MNIGFDLDKIFINFPPLVPDKIIDLFYKEKANRELKYRMPSKIEQFIRISSHHPIFRSLNANNLNYIKNPILAKQNNFYLISSRFGFLKQRTADLIQKYDLNKVFKKMYFNYENRQPHEFKNEIIKKLKLDKFVDDDLQLLEYLTNKNPGIKFFWLNNDVDKPLKKNLIAIKHLSEMFT
jgi:hypothetical protein